MCIDLSAGADASRYDITYCRQVPQNAKKIWADNELWLRRIPSGTFTMGSPNNELKRNSNELQHSVTLTQDFFIGVFPVTQKQWELVMGYNPSQRQSDFSRPVVNVSYDDICGKFRPWPEEEKQSVAPDSFLGRLRERTGLQGLDLPTEAQWEYACRAGTTTALNNSTDLTTKDGRCPNLDNVAWYDKNSGKTTHPVGQKRPNAWGLYDMHGNVWEWCRDWEDYYPNELVEEDPIGPVIGMFRVCRGGSWYSFASFCRSAYRGQNDESWRDDSLGFRLALVPAQG